MAAFRWRYPYNGTVFGGKSVYRASDFKVRWRSNELASSLEASIRDLFRGDWRSRVASNIALEENYSHELYISLWSGLQKLNIIVSGVQQPDCLLNNRGSFSRRDDPVR